MRTRTMKRPELGAPTAEWMVYGDALQEAGDPLGELISLHDRPELRDAFVVRNAAKLLGRAGAHLESYRLGWQFCVLDSVEVRVTRGDDGAELVRAVLASEVAEELREVVVVGVADPGPDPDAVLDLGPAMDALANAELPARCRSLAFVDERAAKASMLMATYFDPPPNLVKLGSLEPFWARAEHVRIEVADAEQIRLGKIVAPQLRSFVLRDLRFAQGNTAQALAAAVWPKLETFELRLAEEFVANIPLERDPYVSIYSGERVDGREMDAEEGENHSGMDYTAIEPLLLGLRSCPMKRLALTSFDSWQSLFDVLARVGLPPALKELDLSDSSLDTNAAAWMRAHAPLFAHVERLVIERVPLADGGVLGRLGPAIVHSRGGGASYRFVVGAE